MPNSNLADWELSVKPVTERREHSFCCSRALALQVDLPSLFLDDVTCGLITGL